MMYNRFSCVANGPSQFAYEHLKQLDCVPFLGTSAEASTFIPVSCKYQVPDVTVEEDIVSKPKGDARLGHESNCEFSVVVSKALDTKTANIPGVNALKSSSPAQSSNEIAKFENLKRPSTNHSFDEAAYKRARRDEPSTNLEQFLETPVPSISFGPKPSSDIQGEEDLYDPLPSQRTRFEQPEHSYSPFTESSRWKHVYIGPQHQADVPEFRSHSRSSLPVNKTSLPADLEFDESSSAEKWLGTRVVLMPDDGSVSMEAQSLGPTFDCCCGDSGSIGCVRSHIQGARESLERALGHEKFMKLGLCDMGEAVAQKWTINMQNSFRRVVLSNPGSSGRNFWHRLAAAFPTRSCEELVGYYFNVFVLRKLAEQNRVDPLNADSNSTAQKCHFPQLHYQRSHPPLKLSPPKQTDP